MTTTITLAELERRGEPRARNERLARDHAGADRPFRGGDGRPPVDPRRSRSAANGPFGTTVAHGYLTLSMLPMLLSEVVSVSDAVMGVNYGTEKIRFTSPVPSGSRVRLHAKLAARAARPERRLDVGVAGRDRRQGKARARRRGRLHGRGGARCLRRSSSPRRGRRSGARARARSSTLRPDDLVAFAIDAALKQVPELTARGDRGRDGRLRLPAGAAGHEPRAPRGAARRAARDASRARR